MASPYVIVGPVEIHSSDDATTDARHEPEPMPENREESCSSAGDEYAMESHDDPSMHATVSCFGSTRVGSPLMGGFTENMSATFVTTGNPCLDFFFHVVPYTPPESIKSRLDFAWKQDPLTTLKLICNLRAVRGTGKSDKEGFYTAALWLYSNHPKTLAGNVGLIGEFGYFKDLPEILFRILGCEESRYRMENIQETEPQSRKHKKIFMSKNVIQRLASDSSFRLLHESVTDLFATRLVADIRLFVAGETTEIGLAAKWCPSLDSSYDRATLLCESIARKIFPRESSPEYTGIEEQHYAYRIRDRLRKEVLVPLRRTLDLPEVYMSSNLWNSTIYERVASVAMKRYKKIFSKHDGDRFMDYLGRVKRGDAKIAAGALLPHEIISSLGDGGNSISVEVAELQWRRMVEDVGEKGKLRNCLAVCDVSGSMNGTPMDVSVAMGILLSELCEEPWKGKVITFSEEPELHVIQGDSLLQKVSFVKKMNWGMNTDFQKVFDRILEMASAAKLSPEKMIKRVFVFSDMEFDEACSTDWKTDYQVIAEKYQRSDYGSAMPEIVFWNLRDSLSTPVTGDQKGVALVSGFSKNVITLFLDGGGIVDPVSVMEAAIRGGAYENLVVLD